MKLFIDTANVDHIKEVASWGVLSGVTTNPSLIAKEGRDFREVIEEICAIVDGPISAEAVSPDAEGMMKEARKFSAWHPNVTIKLPMTDEGLKATAMCHEEGIKTNVTLIFSPSQALLAAKAGATFVSPFVGRLDDISHTGMELVQTVVAMYENYGIETEVIVASVRNPLHVIEAAMVGGHIATIPYKVFKQMLAHPLTDIGIQKFLADWEKVPK
ncbi:MAG: fructose-6-phosphate aldolase [Thermoplasmata archaeon]|nr:fructose-6-phosphate aldolase [Thermoplasmata archaeon]NIS11013.1 fructose-6-phosphate aldolase [Thermoplasmata archaeon]NIS18945.1 fructose-6-phosphate aldolase [Thermoplasmata archaeon]NIT75994.1 fructose-6-phosphate aldolase [Thermoplasmata archaeon]NIU48094.1 fructose-6-phosphate aldolase [Thermoplasmata archaeon]